jgi:hypothetical protein
LSLRDGDDGLLARCWGGCDTRDVLRELRQRGLLDDHHRSHDLRIVARNENPARTENDRKSREARAMWFGAEPLAGSHAQAYLRTRGLDMDNPSLRSTSKFQLAPGVVLPAMIAAVLSRRREIVAVQVTLLDPIKAQKASIANPRRTFGALAAGAVRLGPAGDVLGLAEGAETGLSAMQLSGVPTWCCLGAQRMYQVAIPASVRELHIFADDDEAGRAAAERTARENRHRRVVIRLPAEGFNDWNDYLCARSEAA